MGLRWRGNNRVEKLHNEEFNDMYSSNTGEHIKKMGACSTYGGHEMFILGFGEETYGKETTWKTQA
jgi:hypothetical protein